MRHVLAQVGPWAFHGPVVGWRGAERCWAPQFRFRAESYAAHIDHCAMRAAVMPLPSLAGVSGFMRNFRTDTRRSIIASSRSDAVQPLRTARPVGPGRAVPGPRERPPPRPEQYGAVPHIDSGILPRCPSIVRRYGLPLCTGRGRSSYAVNEASRSPIGPGALQAPGHPRAAAAALLRCCWRGPGPGPAAPPPGEAARAGAADPGPFAHRPAAVVIGTAAVKTVLPEIPPETLAEWQRVVDLTARLARVPASLIMRTERPKHTVLVT